MRYPKMAAQRSTTISVPQLNGGVNLCDMQHAIGDNQLSACENVWWLDGALRTRPVLTKGESLNSTFTIRQRISDSETMLMHYQTYRSAEDTKFFAALIRSDGTAQPIGGDYEGGYYNAAYPLGYTAFACRAPKGTGCEWIFFISNGDIVGWDGSQWVIIEPYHPMVMMNCTGTSADGTVNSEAQAVTLEAYNLLSDKFKIGFMTDGKSTVFTMPAGGAIDSLTLTFDGEHTYEASLDKFAATISGVSAAEFGLDSGTYRSVSIAITYTTADGKDMLTFKNTATKTDGSTADVGGLPYSEFNNLIVTVRSGKQNREIINRMQMCMWFGGDQSGLGGGIHLFVAGHPEKPNLLHWSDVNNPLYFPENNYAYVGEDSDAITALAKQGEMMVVMRERDLYTARYVSGEVPTEEEMENAAAIETTVHKSYFPIAQLHPTIGCRCPQSVRLVNNRLVWADIDGRVYVLAGSSQYSERNVRDVSPLIDKALRQHTQADLCAAVAAEYEGYYGLLVADTMYLMDAQTSAFNSINYYSREETAQKTLPWYVWKLPRADYAAFIAHGDRAVLVSNDAVYTFGGDDGAEKIVSSFTTKQFEFGRIDRLKAVGQMYIRLGIREGGAAEITYITNRYSRSDPYIIESDEAVDERDPKFVKTYRLTPNIHRVESLGVRVTSEHRMAIEGITIQYKNEGVVR